MAPSHHNRTVFSIFNPVIEPLCGTLSLVTLTQHTVGMEPVGFGLESTGKMSVCQEGTGTEWYQKKNVQWNLKQPEWLT